MKMTNEQWEAMSDKEKYVFLKNGKKKLNTLFGIDPKSKVNGSNCGAVKCFNISIGGVTMTLNCLTESEAYKQVDQNIEQWNS